MTIRNKRMFKDDNYKEVYSPEPALVIPAISRAMLPGTCIYIYLSGC
jgi:hypothetical protein